MIQDHLNAERQAVESLADLLERAEKCRLLFELAHMALPEPLKRILGVGVDGSVKGHSVSPLVIPPPEMRSMPPEAGPDWIWIRAKDATPTSLALAVLRGEKEPMRPQAVFARVAEICPEVSRGTIANIGTRLSGKIIKRTEDGWSLIHEGQAGILHEDWLWGPPSIFDKQDLAVHRRGAILHVLRHYSAGLQTLQILEQLSNCSWVRAPLNKDLVKIDLEVLFGEGKVRRRGNTKKWEIASKEKEG